MNFWDQYLKQHEKCNVSMERKRKTFHEDGHCDECGISRCSDYEFKLISDTVMRRNKENKS